MSRRLADRLAVVDRLQHRRGSARASGGAGRAHRDGARARGRGAPPSSGSALRAAATAASTSAAGPRVDAGEPLAGRGIERRRTVAAAGGCANRPPMKWPKPSLCVLRARRRRARCSPAPGRSPSCCRMSLTRVMALSSGHRVAVGGGIAAGDEMLELALDVGRAARSRRCGRGRAPATAGRAPPSSG